MLPARFQYTVLPVVKDTAVLPLRSPRRVPVTVPMLPAMVMSEKSQSTGANVPFTVIVIGVPRTDEASHTRCAGSVPDATSDPEIVWLLANEATRTVSVTGGAIVKVANVFAPLIELVAPPVPPMVTVLKV